MLDEYTHSTLVICHSILDTHYIYIYIYIYSEEHNPTHSIKYCSNNNKHSNPANINWSPTSRRPIYPDRTNPNNTLLYILHSKPDNNKIMR